MEIFTYSMWEVRLLLSTHLSNLQNDVSSMGPDCLEINLSVSLSCVPSIRPSVLHYELSRYVCLITEQLFKFLSSWLLCSYQRLFMMHHFSSGTNGAKLKAWQLNTVRQLLFFLSCLMNIFIFLIWCVQKNLKGAQHAGCTSAQLSQKRN